MDFIRSDFNSNSILRITKPDIQLRLSEIYCFLGAATYPGPWSPDLWLFPYLPGYLKSRVEYTADELKFAMRQEIVNILAQMLHVVSGNFRQRLCEKQMKDILSMLIFRVLYQKNAKNGTVIEPIFVVYHSVVLSQWSSTWCLWTIQTFMLGR